VKSSIEKGPKRRHGEEPPFKWNEKNAPFSQYLVLNNDKRSQFKGTNFFILQFGNPSLDIEDAHWNSGEGYITDIELAKYLFNNEDDMRDEDMCGVVEYAIPKDVFGAEVLKFAKEADENRRWFGLGQVLEVKTNAATFRTVQSQNRKFALRTRCPIK
jgi:hypothetical protein